MLWSAGGADHAAARIAPHAVSELFDGIHDKDQRDEHGHYVPSFLDGTGPVVFVDDRPEDLPVDADIVAVSPYLSPNPHDRGLSVVASRAGLRTNDELTEPPTGPNA